MNDIHLYMLGGLAGVGKTTVGRELSRQTGFSFHDKDRANPLSEALLIARGSHRDDRESPTYLSPMPDIGYSVRALEYQVMMGFVRDNLSSGHSAIVVAPFGPEFRDAKWQKEFQQECDAAAGQPVGVHRVWLTLADDVLKQRLIDRGEPRDRDKLKNWDTFLATANATRPLQPCLELDVSDGKTREHAETIITTVSPGFAFGNRPRALPGAKLG